MIQYKHIKTYMTEKYTKRLVVTVTQSTHTKFKIKCAKEFKDITLAVRELIEKDLKEKK